MPRRAQNAHTTEAPLFTDPLIRGMHRNWERDAVAARGRRGRPPRLRPAPHDPHRRTRHSLTRFPCTSSPHGPPFTDRKPHLVTAWTPAEQEILTGSEALTLFAGDHDQTSVEVGMVLVDGELYVRAYRRTGSRWYQAAGHHGHGRIHVGTVTRDVLLSAVTGDELTAAIDAAYHAKYGGVGSIATTPAARPATIRISPAQAEAG